MIRLALVLSVFTLLTHTHLPAWRAHWTRPFYQQCLNFTPDTVHRSEIRSLVCGHSLRESSNPAAWRNLGLIHILVVSGGHLSILASLLSIALSHQSVSPRFRWRLISSVLLLFCLANRLQPPVLRAFFEWVFRAPLKARGWRAPETALISTWVALPFCSSIFDLLSLALSFFASVTVERTSNGLHRRPILTLVALQSAVWWVLLPLLFTLGIPHPVSTLVNVILAPLLGVTLIPLAMLAWLSGTLPILWGREGDPVYLGALFDGAWFYMSKVIARLSAVLPEATPKIKNTTPLLFGVELSTVLLFSLLSGSIALLIRTRREGRAQAMARIRAGLPWRPWAMIAISIIASVLLHGQINAYLQTR